MKHGIRKRGKIPSYWWDFEWVGNDIRSVIVETDDPRHEKIIHRITINEDTDIKRAIEIAETYIYDLKAGRCTP